MPEEKEYTTISILGSTKERIERIGGKGETWDDLLNRILSVYEKVKKP